MRKSKYVVLVSCLLILVAGVLVLSKQKTPTVTGKAAGPVVDSLFPPTATSRVGDSRVFIATYSHSVSVQDLNDMYLLIIGGKQDQGVRYNQRSNQFMLLGATEKCSPGQAITLSTPFLILDCKASLASRSGTILTLTLNLQPRSASAGLQYRLILHALDKAGGQDGKLAGTWTVR